MPIKPDREYRNLGAFETKEVNLRAGEQENFLVSGYASTFEPYLLMRIDDTDCYERVDKDAFNDADLSDVVFLRDHAGRVFARTKNDTLKLSVDEHGLFTEADLSKTGGAREMFEDIESGNYSQMSFAFTVADEEMEENEDGSITRVIKRFGKLYDVSAVSFPANPTTDIGVSARGAFDGVIEKRTAERLAAEVRKRELEKIKLKAKIAKG